MRQLWFVRHGESTANAAAMFAGHDDVDLTPQGEQQARDLAPYFAGLPVERVLSSDLKRAWRTAALAWPRPVPRVERVRALRERHMGGWEGRPYADLTPDDRACLTAWEGEPPGGESQAMLARRVLGWLATEDDGRSTALFVHGGLIRTVVGLLDDVPTDQIGTRRVHNAECLERQVPVGRWAELLARL